MGEPGGPNLTEPERGGRDACDAARLSKSGDSGRSESVSAPKEGTISRMTEVIGVRAARLEVRSPGPGRWPRELKDHDWLRE